MADFLDPATYGLDKRGKQEKEPHIHKFKLTTKNILLAKYRSENGEISFINTTAKDTLKQKSCECGKVLTYDLVRMLV